MEINKTPLLDCYTIYPNIYKDHRGFFFESFNKKKFEDSTRQEINFVQDNQSQSSKGVLRGLHYQKGMHAQAKLVRVIQGSVQDIVVDIRPKSRTFGKHFSITLSSVNNIQLFIPRGFAHGFLALEDDTIFSYKCDNYYNKTSESGIIYNDKTLNIKWLELDTEYLLSDKDLELQNFEELVL